MNPWLTVAIAVGGGAGAAVRYSLDALVTSRTSAAPFPLGTLLINVSGSFVLGIVTGLAAAHLPHPELFVIAGTGFLGGYTTFSTASTQTADLVRGRKYGAAAIYSGGMLLGAVISAAAGLWFASAIT